MFFLLVVNYNPPIFHGHENTEPYILDGAKNVPNFA